MTRGIVLDREFSKPELISLSYGSDDEDALPSIHQSKRLRHRVLNNNFKVPAILEVLPKANFHYFIC